MSKELRGHGTVYQRGNTWWIQYCKNGKSYRESSRSDRIVFVEGIDGNSREVQNIFVNSLVNNRLSVTMSRRGYQETHPNGDRYLVLVNGRRYDGTPGTSEYTMYRDDEADPAIVICQVGSTKLTYQARAIDDLAGASCSGRAGRCRAASWRCPSPARRGCRSGRE